MYASKSYIYDNVFNLKTALNALPSLGTYYRAWPPSDSTY